MSQVNTSFPDSTYSSSNKPSVATLKADISSLEIAQNDTDSTAVKLTESQTMTNKILTSPVINTQITGSAIVDEDDMDSNSAVKVPTQQSVKAYIASIMSTLNPIGTIREFNVSTNPATLLGFGTWSAYGTGRVTVAIDATDVNFDTVNEEYGEATHALTEAELATHTHVQNAHSHLQANTGATMAEQGNDLYVPANSSHNTHASKSTTATNQNTGSGTAHNNIQPSIVVYRWVRTA